MQSLLQIRHLSEADTLAYYALRMRSMESLVDPVEPQVFRELEAGTNGIAALVAGYVSEGTHVVGAFHGDTLVAAAALTRQCHAAQDGIGRLWGVFVLPRYRGTPASRLLMASIIEYCSADGDIRQLLASCGHDNVAGLRFLQRLGFEAIPAADSGSVHDESSGLFSLQIWRSRHEP